MNFQSPNLQDLEQIINSLLSEGKCACHFINPHKTRILMWKQEKDGKTIYFLKIGIQKFTSQEQIDRNGEVYWRYWSLEEHKPEPTKIDSITKFNQRQEKVKEYGKSNNLEPSVNEQSN